MKKPYIEVVRFNAEDVIATSMYPLTQNLTYFTKRQELLDSNPIAYGNYNDDYYLIKWESIHGFHSWVPHEAAEGDITRYPYAWFDSDHNAGGNWHTMGAVYDPTADKPGSYSGNANSDVIAD